VAASPPAEPVSGEDVVVEETARFDPRAHLISLHYDHAPDRDDGHSAAADRTLLQSLHGEAWFAAHTLPVSGAYGKNKKAFNERSDAVMDAVFGEGRWVAADEDWDKAVAAITRRWMQTLEAGGDVWVKEGGQSDITADVVRVIREKHGEVDTTRRIHVVQHSNWNEKQTTDADLRYVTEHTGYIRIKDANRYLNRKGGDDAFEKAAVAHPVFGPSWEAAFAYYDPDHRLDFSDTGELMHVLGLGEVGIDAFRKRYLEAEGR